MNVVATFQSPILAMRAARRLRDAGIAAGISQVTGFGPVSVDVFVTREADRPRARELLAQAATDDIAEEDVLEQSLPDLRRLPSTFAPACPGCKTRLPLDELLEHCPTCKAEVDVPSLVAEQFSPEVLIGCYPDAPGPESLHPDLLAAIVCPCGYSLAGSAPAGLCPECGAEYDKLIMLRERGLA